MYCNAKIDKLPIYKKNRNFQGALKKLYFLVFGKQPDKNNYRSLFWTLFFIHLQVAFQNLKIQFVWQ